MGIYNPKRRTEDGAEEIKFPKSSIYGLNDTINAITDIIGGLASNNDSMVGTWVFIDNPALPSESFAIRFTDGLGTEYGAIDYSAVEEMFYYSYELGNFDVDAYFGFAGGREWAYEEAKIINILEEPSTEAASWIKANAVKQSSGSASLETEAQNIIGAINELNDKTVDKLGYINLAKAATEYAIPFGAGIMYKNTYETNFGYGDVENYIPIVAGENVTFEGTTNAQDVPVVKINASGGGTEIVTTTGTGAAYVATVSGITELKVGVNFIMIPHTVSTSGTPTLNVNGLGAIRIYRQSIGSTSVYSGYYTNWLGANKPYRVMYNGTYWILVDLPKTVAGDLSGRVPVSNGGVPSSTTSNAGQVLTVNSSGTPAWATPSSSGSADLSKFYPMFCQALAIPKGIQEVDQMFYSIDAYEANGNTVLGEDLIFDDLVEQSMYGISSEFELELYNNTDFVLKVCVKVTWEELLQEITPREKFVVQYVSPQDYGYVLVEPIEQDAADERSWGYEILGARFMLNDYD